MNNDETNNPYTTMIMRMKIVIIGNDNGSTVDKHLLWSRKRAKLVFSLICGQALDRDGEPGDRGGDEDDHDGVDLQVEQVVDHGGAKLAPASHCQLTRLISFTSLGET